MRERVEKFIKDHNLISPGDKVLVGISGGADSVVLTHLLAQLQETLDFSLYGAHMNHSLRGAASDEDQAFSEQFCNCLSIPFFSEEIDITALAEKWLMTEEEAGRYARYGFFNRVLRDIQGDRIATAHHKDDQAETILHHIIRGAGLNGLGGMKPAREGIYIKPLLNTTRSDIEGYISRNNLQYREDLSNRDIKYTRNRIRHRLIPMLEEEFNPNIVETLSRMARLLRDEDDFIQSWAQRLFNRYSSSSNGRVYIDTQCFDESSKAVGRRIIRLALKRFNRSLNGIAAVNIEDVLALAISGRSGSLIMLPGDIKVYRDYFQIEISHGKEDDQASVPDIPINYPGCFDIKEFDINIDIQKTREYDVGKSSNWCIYINESAVSGQLRIRSRKPGDRFSPLGLGGSKKLKDYFIDKKIPLYKRDRIPLIVDDKNIIWVVGLQMSELYRVKENDDHILKISVENTKEGE